VLHNLNLPAAPIPTAMEPLQHHLWQLLPDTLWSVQVRHFQGLAAVLAHSITDGKVITVSDGSLKLHLGRATYHIEDSSKVDEVPLEGPLQVPGLPQDLTSHHFELGGLYRIVTVVKMVISIFSLQDGYCWTNIVSTLLLLGIRSLNALLAHSIAVNTSHRSFGYYKPRHTSPLLH
jgi:hypothetical protein